MRKYPHVWCIGKKILRVHADSPHFHAHEKDIRMANTTQNGDMIYRRYRRTWKCITLPLHYIFQSCQNEHALFGRKMCNVANTRFLDNFCGRYFGRYNAVWSIFGLFLLWSIFITTPLAALYLSRDVKVYHSAIKWRNTKISANILFNMYLLGNRICNSSAILNIRTFVAKCVML